MRNVFASTLYDIAAHDDDVFLLTGDIGNKLFDRFKGSYPERFINCGIAEANMISFSCGLSTGGYKPVCYTIAPFITARCYEQVRIDVGYHNSNVTLVGTGSGLSYASLGATHHGFDDLAIMRAIPGIDIYTPADSHDLRACLRSAISNANPSYIRIGKKGEPEVNSLEIRNIDGSGITYRDGEDICIINCGTTLALSIELSDNLLKDGIKASVVHFSRLRPICSEYIEQLASKFKIVATVEEHLRSGGLGTSVLEAFSDLNIKIRPSVIRFGMPEEFIHDLGSQEYVRTKCGLNIEFMKNKIKKSIEN